MRWRVFAKRFQMIEKGLFRSGQMRAWPYERMVRRHGIRTVLRLNILAPGRPERREEDAIVRRHGLELREIIMSGSGVVPFETLDEAADFVADRGRWPLLFHCSAGDKRSSAVTAAFLLRHRGRTWEQVAAELERQGLARDDALFAHLERYARDAPARDAAL